MEIYDTEMNIVRAEADEATEIWKKYQKGVEQHDRARIFENTRRAHKFFIGEQWSGLESGGEEMPIFNFLQPIVEHKVASVAMNSMTINYSPMAYGAEHSAQAQACDKLNAYAMRQWELLKMDKLGWDIIKDACIAGDSYLYFYDRDLHAQVIDNTNIYFGDETSTDLQSQPFIIIAERRFLRDVRRDAKANGISQEEIEKIAADEDYKNQISDDARLGGELEQKRCTSLLYFTKNDDGIVSISRSTKEVIYQSDVVLQATDEKTGEHTGAGLTIYPIASLVWINKKNSSRGVGEVLPLIPNQIEENKMLVRRLMNAKITAFGRLVYNINAIDNADSINKVGTAIGVSGIAASKVTDIVAYLHPSPMSGDAKTLSDELIDKTRDLAGAGDAALGQINPEQASGAAIIAVRDQAALPLNEQIAQYKQFCEDIAGIWFAMWIAYNPQGMSIEIEQSTDAMVEPVSEFIDAQTLTDMRVNIRIDVSPSNPYSKYAQEQSLTALMQAGAITFEEYVAALDENASTPKQKLQEIIDKRKEIQLQQQQMIGQELPQEVPMQEPQATPPDETAQLMDIINRQQQIIESFEQPQDALLQGGGALI